MPGAWAYARAASSAAHVRATLPDIVGSDGARLVLRGGGEPVGPPDGAVRFNARWLQGRSSGEADVLILPVSETLCEVHVSLVSSRGLPRREARLTRLAGVLARAVADAAEPTTGRRAEQGSARSRWVYVPATGTSRSR